MKPSRYLGEKADALNDLRDIFFQLAQEKGFHEKPRTLDGLIALVHSELSEALEHWRNNHECDEVWIDEDGKPDGVPIELADVLIRVLAMCGYYNIDIAHAVARKHAFNTTRPHKHGGKRA